MVWEMVGQSLTEELLCCTALPDYGDRAGLQLLDNGNVVRQNTHVTRIGGDVDLNNVLGLVDGLRCGN